MTEKNEHEIYSDTTQWTVIARDRDGQFYIYLTPEQIYVAVYYSPAAGAFIADPYLSNKVAYEQYLQLEEQVVPEEQAFETYLKTGKKFDTPLIMTEPVGEC